MARRGRPTLYKTPEEKAIANRAKSKHSYDKRLTVYSSRLMQGARKDKDENARASSDDPDTTAGWLRLATATSKEFRQITNNFTSRYIDSLYQKYLVVYKADVFTHDIPEIKALHRTLTRCQDAVLQLEGVGKEFRAVETIGKGVHTTLLCLEELACYASVGKAEILALHQSRSLMYQDL
ncbi:hypothetical protein PLEOSDRAFT_171717 [Pleurotus ostreatus PC15]|uniref:Uncharacterized protein n=1 Tax=Pleurotus ostreatus (strain PC15) TaxID=1137138 RepID=A0A067N374_PLEO1|nr:hypothetical protein PLEOSDRAFT_171717 [Pleurotus ostreatus PC15]